MGHFSDLDIDFQNVGLNSAEIADAARQNYNASVVGFSDGIVALEANGTPFYMYVNDLLDDALWFDVLTYKEEPTKTTKPSNRSHAADSGTEFTVTTGPKHPRKFVYRHRVAKML